MTVKEFVINCIDRAEAASEPNNGGGEVEAIRLLELAREEIGKLIGKLKGKEWNG